MVGSMTGCASAFRLAKSARMATERLTRWAAEMGGGGRRRRWAAEVGGGGGRRRAAAQRAAAAGGGKVVGVGATVRGGRQGGRGNSARRWKKCG